MFLFFLILNESDIRTKVYCTVGNFDWSIKTTQVYFYNANLFTVLYMKRLKAEKPPEKITLVSTGKCAKNFYSTAAFLTHIGQCLYFSLEGAATGV